MLSSRLADLVEDVSHMRLDHANHVSALEAGWADERQDLLERLKISQHELVQARCIALATFPSLTFLPSPSPPPSLPPSAPLPLPFLSLCFVRLCPLTATGLDEAAAL